MLFRKTKIYTSISFYQRYTPFYSKKFLRHQLFSTNKYVTILMEVLLNFKKVLKINMFFF